MPKVTESVKLNKTDEIDFESPSAITSTVEWGTRHEANDEIWQTGENTVGDVDVLWYECVINDRERKEIKDILANIP